MKNKLFTVPALLFTLVLLASCATQRSYGSHKKGYGCPNSTGMKLEVKSPSLPA